MDDDETSQRRNKRSQRAAIWREKGGLKAQQDRSRRNHNISQQRKDLGCTGGALCMRRRDCTYLLSR